MTRTERLKNLAERIGEVIDELMDEFPDCGFFLAALFPVNGGEHTEVTAISNLDDQELPDFLNAIINDGLNEVPIDQMHLQKLN